VGSAYGTYRYKVAGTGFWQVHRAAPAVLVDAVLDALGDVGGCVVLDMYSGSGLFTLPLADAVGPAGRIIAVEADAKASADARRNAHDMARIDLRHGDVLSHLDSMTSADAVVLDPPRAGAGRGVVEAIARCGAPRVVYVACDPAALARDLGYFAAHGYLLGDLRAFDLFPMTHHVEAVATLTR
jgi:tRNA/tmRNA/rRNA uracil-C5-methylase (TrmA/RlmC/RlmD family)